MTSGPHAGAAADDPELFALVDAELRRRAQGLQLIASETPASAAVLAAMGSGLDAKYAEGYPGLRYHGGCEVIDQIEELAIARARALFGGDYINVQPLSGSIANLAVYAAFALPDDPILALRLAHGGHQTHGSRANFSGRWFTAQHYEVREDTEQIDYDRIRDLALVHRPRILVAGAAAYSRHIDFTALRAIADEADCILWADAAHLAGLAAAGLTTSPVPYADVVTFSTNKVLRGPRGGAIIAREEHREALSKAVFPFLQGGPSMSTIAAKAVCFAESAGQGFADYAGTVIANAAALSAALAERGLRTVSGGTDTHLAVIDLTSLGMSGVDGQRRLAAAGIVVDKAVLPFDDRPVAEGSAIRIGTPTITVDGFGPADMTTVAGWMVDALRAEPGDTGTQRRIRTQITDRIAR